MRIQFESHLPICNLLVHVEINSRFINFPPLFYFPIFFCLLFFPLLYLPNFPFLLSPFYSPFLLTILSNFFQNDRFTGWWTYGSSSPSILPHHESYRYPHYPILIRFYSHNFAGSRFHIPCSVIYILHPIDPQSTF
jgi:hypothetical protein